MTTETKATSLHDMNGHPSTDYIPRWKAKEVAAEADARIADLEEENAELRKDAERYRWLRKQSSDTWQRIGWNTWGTHPSVIPQRDDDIDAEIAASVATGAAK